MNKEIEYASKTKTEHLKNLGQYFTPYPVAEYMCRWACQEASSMLDPAAGNSVFLNFTKQLYPACSLHGYEIDGNILDFFGNPSGANLMHLDYLLNDWNSTYDAIVCNPPYNRFQAVSNRSQIIDCIYAHTQVKYSTYTNLYIMFLIKSLHQLSPSGRLAYIIPTEFLNSKYGIAIKEKLIREKLLKTIINFENDRELFFHATTTCCILLVDHTQKEYVSFYNLSSLEELQSIDPEQPCASAARIPYSQIKPEEKWRIYLRREQKSDYANLTDVSEFCSISRGIATGANDYFCLSKSKMAQNKIPESAVSKCISHCADIKSPIFTSEDFDRLDKADKTVFVLDINRSDAGELGDYIAAGEAMGVDQKHLPSCRNPWYSMEQKKAAPIWAASANRGGIKFVRNLAGVKTLTTFHCVFVKEPYANDTDIIFCYFLTPIAQNILRENRKELGNGLEKFQPGDLKSAKMLDLTLLSAKDKAAVLQLYHRLCDTFEPNIIEQLNAIFSRYLTTAQPSKP